MIRANSSVIVCVYCRMYRLCECALLISSLITGAAGLQISVKAGGPTLGGHGVVEVFRAVLRGAVNDDPCLEPPVQGCLEAERQVVAAAVADALYVRVCEAQRTAPSRMSRTLEQ